MKRKRLIITALLCSGLLISCGGPSEKDEPPITDTDPDKPDKPTPEPEEPQKEDFTVKTSCDAGSFTEDSYVFTTTKSNDDYFSDDDPIVRVNINKKDWSYVTAIVEDSVKILSENEEFLPSTAVTYVLDDGEGMDVNDIEGIDFKIDRTKLKVGTTKLKIHVEPSNGVNTASDLDLCVPIEIKEFGSIGPKVEKTKFDLDITGVDKKYIEQGVEFIIRDEDHVYGASNDKSQITVLKAEKTSDVEIDLPIGNRLSLDLVYRNDSNKWEHKKLKMESDSSFNQDGEYYIFDSKPSSNLKISLA